MIEIKSYKLQYLRDSWNKLASDILLDNESSKRTFSFLLHMYSDPRRHYHNLNHIYDCLNLIDGADVFDTGVLKKTDEKIIKLAIWFHDVYYTSGYPTIDEEMSIKILSSIIPENVNVPLHKVAKLIDLTSSHTTNNQISVTDEVSKTFLDIDLSVMAYKKDLYDEYVNNITAEYKAFHPLSDINKMKLFRITFLNSILNKKKIYLSSTFENLQKEAVENIKRELERYKNE